MRRIGNVFDGFLSKYNFTDFHELNLDWLIVKMIELNETVKNFVTLNAIKYADPIQWNIASQYEKNTVVVDPQTGTAYLSVAPVPSGVALSNPDYWTVIFDLDIAQANNNITLRDDGNNVLSTFTSDTGDWLLWNGTLYRVTQPIGLSQAYVEGYNIERYTVELFVKDYIDSLTTITGDLANAIGDLNDLNTTDKTNVVNAINEVLNTCNLDIVTPQMFGAVGDGMTDDTSAFVAAFNASNAVIVPKGDYLISDTINVPDYGMLIGTGERSRIFSNAHKPIIEHSGEPIIIKNLVLDRPAGFTAVAGDTGLKIGGSSFAGRGVIENIIVGHCWNGFHIIGGSIGTYNELISLENKNNGFELENIRGEFTACLAQYNENDGFHLYQSSDGETGAEFSMCGTFCNQRYGWLANIAAGVTNAANLMMRGCNASFDGVGGFRIDDYHNIWLLNGLSEYAGNATSIKPAFTSINNAVGIELRNCRSVVISNMIVNHNTGSGIRSVANTDIIFSSLSVSDNGSGGVSGYQEGFDIYNTTKFEINGSESKNIDTAYQAHDLNINPASTGIVDGLLFNTFYLPDTSNIIFGTYGNGSSNTIEGASDLQLPFGHEYVKVTGDHNIYSLGSAIPGHVVTLHFTGSGALVEGAYLHLSTATLYYTPNSTVTFIYIGSAGWNEVSHHIA